MSAKEAVLQTAGTNPEIVFSPGVVLVTRTCVMREQDFGPSYPGCADS